MKQLDLDQLLQVRYEYILERYSKDHPNNELSAETAWQELMKYFWLGQQLRIVQKNNPDDENSRFEAVMHTEMSDIDDMWHTFLLFTREYADFCQQHFGHFIHHAPNISKQPVDSDKFEHELELYFSFIYDQLGEDTLKLWFKDLL